MTFNTQRLNIYNLCGLLFHFSRCNSFPNLTESPLLPRRSTTPDIPPSPGWAGSRLPAECSRCDSGPAQVWWLKCRWKRGTGHGGLEPVASPSPEVCTSCTTAQIHCWYPWRQLGFKISYLPQTYRHKNSAAAAERVSQNLRWLLAFQTTTSWDR